MRFGLCALVISCGSLFAGPVSYTFDITTESPVKPIHFSFVANDFLTDTGLLNITPFQVTDTLGHTWNFTNGNVTKNIPGLGCFAIFAPPAIGSAPGTCGADTIPPGGGFLFILGAGGGPLVLPTSDGVFHDGATYSLRDPNGVFAPATSIQPATITVASLPEPSTAISVVAFGLLALWKRNLTRRS